MTALTLRGLWTRKLRAGLTALAVLLGVMMISGTFVFTDTINHSFDRIFDTANQGVDLKVVPHKAVDSQNVPVPPFTESLLARVRSAKGVGKVDGGVSAENAAAVVKADMSIAGVAAASAAAMPVLSASVVARAAAAVVKADMSGAPSD